MKVPARHNESHDGAAGLRSVVNGPGHNGGPPRILTGHLLRELRHGKKLIDELVVLADEKDVLFRKAEGMLVQDCALALTGKASEAVQMLTSGITAFRSTEATVFMPLWLSHSARAYAELRQFDDAWRCIGEALTAVETTKETLFEAEINRMAGEIALKSPEPDTAKAEGISSVRSRLRVSSRRSPGNCAQR